LSRRPPQGVGEIVLDLADVTLDPMGVRALVLFAQSVPGGIALRYPQDALMRGSNSFS
jgi:hypothetical protein